MAIKEFDNKDDFDKECGIIERYMYIYMYMCICANIFTYRGGHQKRLKGLSSEICLAESGIN